MLASQPNPLVFSYRRNIPVLPTPRFLKAPGRGPAGDRVIGLGERLFQVFPFETRRRGEPRTCPPRTVGSVAMLLGGGRGGLNLGPRQAAEVALRGPADAHVTESAKEKVVFCSRTGETLVFQADRQNGSAALCACGNASGAAAALLAQRLNRRRVDQDLHVPDGRLEMRSEVAPIGDGSWRIEQAWTGVRFHMREAEMHGRQVAVCTGSFNDYLVVLLGGAADLERFDLPQVLALWRQARQFSGFDNPLQSRLVALAPQPSGRPFAKFYTCGRTHPGAPLTGMATLAMASGRVSWLASLLEGGAIEHRRGTDPLPSVRATRKGFEIGFPAIDVHLQGI